MPMTTTVQSCGWILPTKLQLKVFRKSLIAILRLQGRQRVNTRITGQKDTLSAGSVFSRIIVIYWYWKSALTER